MKREEIEKEVAKLFVEKLKEMIADPIIYNSELEEQLNEAFKEIERLEKENKELIEKLNPFQRYL